MVDIEQQSLLLALKYNNKKGTDYLFSWNQFFMAKDVAIVIIIITSFIAITMLHQRDRENEQKLSRD